MLQTDKTDFTTLIQNITSIDDVRNVCQVAHGALSMEEELYAAVQEFAQSAVQNIDVPNDDKRGTEIRFCQLKTVFLLTSLPNVPTPVFLSLVSALNSCKHFLPKDVYNAFLNTSLDGLFIKHAVSNAHTAINSLFEMASGRALRDTDLHHTREQRLRRHAMGFDIFYDPQFSAYKLLSFLSMIRVLLVNANADDSPCLLSHRLMDDKRFQRFDYDVATGRVSGAQEWCIIRNFAPLLSVKQKASYIAIESSYGMHLSAQDSFFHSIFEGPQTIGLHLVVRREHILEDSKLQLMYTPPKLLRHQLSISFAGEAGVDHGGIIKEFFQLLSRDLFSDQTTFKTCQETGVVWFVPCIFHNDHVDCENLTSIEKSHIGLIESNCYFAGIVCGLAIYNTVLLESAFPTLLFDALFGSVKQNTFVDYLDEVDLQLAAQLRKFSNNTELADCIFECVSNSIDVECSDGVVREVAINCTNTPDTPQNHRRAKFANEYAKTLLYTLTQRQVAAFSRGIGQVLGAEFYFKTQLQHNSIDIGAKDLSATVAHATSTAHTTLVGNTIEPNAIPELELQELSACLFKNKCNILKSVILGFSAQDMASILCGRSVDRESIYEWRETAVYDGGYKHNTPVVQWFWEWCLGGLPQPFLDSNAYSTGTKRFDNVKSTSSTPSKISKLVAFVTGSRRVPLGGLKSVKLTIMRVAYDADGPTTLSDFSQLPTAHTCFNYLVLPEYPSRKMLIQKLELALDHCEGFGLQ